MLYDPDLAAYAHRCLQQARLCSECSLHPHIFSQRHIAIGHVIAMGSLPPPLILRITKKQLKSITERPHVRILILLELKSLWDNLNVPSLHLRMLSGFEA